MPKQAAQVKVAPSVLSWARSSAGWTIKEVAEKLQVDPRQIEAWEAGMDTVSLTKLKQLSNYYKRPVVALLLPRPPETPPPPPDFRSLPDRQGVFFKETWLALRRARRLQAIAAELMQALEQPAHAVLGKASLDDDPEQIAVRERARFEITGGTQSRWRDASEALWSWRNLLERAGIFTFQMQMPVEDSRGFSLGEREPLAIVVSSGDSMHARIFTLFHEYAHLMMHSSGICLPREEEPSGQPNRMERWCDHFTGAFLMPRNALAEDEDCEAFLQRGPGGERPLSRLSRHYKVSRLAMLTRLLILGWLSRDRYSREVIALGSPRGGGGGRAEYAARIIVKKGRTFTSLVFQALEQNVVGYNEMADYLGVRLKHEKRIRELLSV